MSDHPDERLVNLWPVVADEKAWNEREEIEFPPIDLVPGVTMNVRKRRDKKLKIKISGLYDQNFEFVAPLPNLSQVPNHPDGTLGFSLAVSWRFPVVDLYLNGRAAGKRKARTH